MTNEELKAALLSGCPVSYKGTTYKCVSGIVYRNIDNEIHIIAELKDLNAKSSLLYVDAYYVEEVKKNDSK